MNLDKELTQHIAVFGESGSGKTVLLSAFYGMAQEPDFLQGEPFRITSEDGRGSVLHQNYLGMKNSRVLPDGTRRRSTTYTFRIAPQKASKDAEFDAIRLVWHDYPGEWLEGGGQRQTESERKVATFEQLLHADVALLLVDGQKLLDNAGEEERYLKALLTSVRTELAGMRPALTKHGKITEFPRIWILALSKCDLLPDMDVYAFRDLVIEKAGGELRALRGELESIVSDPKALAIGDDFMLLSAARFSPESIDVTRQVGVGLMVPIATMVPLRRLLEWARKKELPVKAAESLLGEAVLMVQPLIKVVTKLPIVQKVPEPFRKLIVRGVEKLAVGLAETGHDQMKRLHERAVAKHDYMNQMITGFDLSLDDAVKDRSLHLAES